MRIEVAFELLVLLTVANATPAVLGILLRRHLAWPLDAGRNCFDGRRLFGPSKTVRGILGSICASALLAPAFGLEWAGGALFGLLAMSGDLISSFIKRRLGFTPGCAQPLLDQLPEACLPLWLLAPVTGATLTEMALAIALFTVLDLLVSRLYRPDQARCR
jgi:CDP-2,3-bis-(O-geranylgeranyl)-sn-glycerol synthase